MLAITPHTLPDKKSEHYKYSDLQKLLRGLYYQDQSPLPRVFDGTATVERGDDHTGLVRITGAAVIIDDWDLAAGVWQSRAVMVDVAAGAACTYIRLVRGAGALTDQVHVTVAENATLTLVHVQGGAATARTDVRVDLMGARAQADIHGVQSLAPGAHGDLTVSVHHHDRHGQSRQHIRTVVDANATGVFQGKIYVAPTAQKTDAVQSSKAILLSPLAAMNTKPELEIYADDVACAHGATLGALDPNQLFYAMSRGLDAPAARALLTRAFLLSALPDLQDDARALIEHLIDEAGGVA
jgi:Fe-S cluster assembly protein SufD